MQYYLLFTVLAREYLERHPDMPHDAFGLSCAPFVRVILNVTYYFMEIISFERPLAVIGTRFFGEVQRVSVPSVAYIFRVKMDTFLL